MKAFLFIFFGFFIWACSLDGTSMRSSENQDPLGETKPLSFKEKAVEKFNSDFLFNIDQTNSLAQDFVPVFNGTWKYDVSTLTSTIPGAFFLLQRDLYLYFNPPTKPGFFSLAFPQAENYTFNQHTQIVTQNNLVPTDYASSVFEPFWNGSNWHITLWSNETKKNVFWNTHTFGNNDQLIHKYRSMIGDESDGSLNFVFEIWFDDFDTYRKLKLYVFLLPQGPRPHQKIRIKVRAEKEKASDDYERTEIFADFEIMATKQ